MKEEKKSVEKKQAKGKDTRRGHAGYGTEARKNRNLQNKRGAEGGRKNGFESWANHGPMAEVKNRDMKGY